MAFYIYIPLPNGCKMTPIGVYPTNWQSKRAPIKKNWYIWYRFYDPRFSKPKKVQIMGMNGYGKLKDRQEITQQILDYELQQLTSGYNPFTDKRKVKAYWRGRWGF